MAALAAVLALTGCEPIIPGLPNLPGLPGLPGTSISGATPMATVADSATPSGGTPTLTVSEETFSIDTPYPVDTTAEVPVLRGASTEVGQAFNGGFETQMTNLVAQVAAMGVQFASYGAETSCTQDQRDGHNIATVWSQTTANIYQTYATALTMWSFQMDCGVVNHVATSITIDLTTGQPGGIGQFMDPASQQFQAGVYKLAPEQCSLIDTSELMANVEAWSPTPDGLLVAWGSQYVTPGACGAIEITIPYSNIGVFDACEQAPLPAGIDSRVCGPMPKDIVQLAQVSDNWPDTVSFATASHNIGCDLSTANPIPDGHYQIQCGIIKYSFTPPAPTPGANTDYWMGNVASIQKGHTLMGISEAPFWGFQEAFDYNEPITTVQDGQAVGVGTIACVVQDIGVSCWDVTTDHGFFLTDTSYLTW